MYSASSQGGDLAPIRPAFVVGDTLYTGSEAGVDAGSLTDLAERAFVAFPRDEDHPQPQPATDQVGPSRSRHHRGGTDMPGCRRRLNVEGSRDPADRFKDRSAYGSS